MANDAGWGAPGPVYGPGPGAWGGPPPAPKPGTIPLRPLSLGDVLNGTFSTVGRYWRAVFGFTFAVLAVAALVTAGAGATAYGTARGTLTRALDTLGSPARPSRSDLIELITAFGSVLAVLTVTGLLAMAALQAAYPAIVSRAVLGQPITVRETWRQARARMLSVLGTQVLTGLIAVPLMALAAVPAVVIGITTRSPGGVLVGVLLFFLLAVPTVMFLQVRLSLAPAAAVLEKQSPLAALRRSWRLVAGSWWRVFGITLLGGLIGSVAAQFVQVPFNMAGVMSTSLSSVGADKPSLAALAALGGLTTLGTLLGAALSTPFTAIVTTLLYVDLRIRRESLDLTLAEAAGIPPQGSYGT